MRGEGLRAELFDSLVRPVLLHGSEILGATAQIGLTSFGRQESDATEQVHRSFFRSLLGVRASTLGVSILGEFGKFPLFVDRVRAISLYLNRLIGLRGSGRLVSIAFEDSVRLGGGGVHAACYCATQELPSFDYGQGMVRGRHTDYW
jgi:hypothetical protein